MNQAIARAGVGACRTAFGAAVEATGAAPERLMLGVGFGVDGAGLVCAVVQHEIPRPIDPRVADAVDAAGRCLKEALFRARFPAGRVKGQERLVHRYVLALGEVGTSTAAEP